MHDLTVVTYPLITSNLNLVIYKFGTRRADLNSSYFYYCYLYAFVIWFLIYVLGIAHLHMGRGSYFIHVV